MTSRILLHDLTLLQSNFMQGWFSVGSVSVFRKEEYLHSFLFENILNSSILLWYLTCLLVCQKPGQHMFLSPTQAGTITWLTMERRQIMC